MALCGHNRRPSGHPLRRIVNISFFRITSFFSISSSTSQLVHTNFPFKKSAQIVHYQEYIKGEKDIGQDAGRIKQGAQNLTEIEEVETPILTEVKKRLQKQDQDLKKNQALIEAKERLKQAEKEHDERKSELEKKQK